MSRNNEVLMAERRRLLRLAVAGGTALVIGGGFVLPRLLAAGADDGLPGLIHTEAGSVLLEVFAGDGRDLGARRSSRLVLNDAEWRRHLSPAAFGILRCGGTEPAFSGQHEVRLHAAFIAARAAPRRCTTMPHSSIPARAGRASGSRLPSTT